MSNVYNLDLKVTPLLERLLGFIYAKSKKIRINSNNYLKMSLIYEVERNVANSKDSLFHEVSETASFK